MRLGLSPDFDFLSREYRELFARSDATAFQHPIWLDRLYALAKKNRHEPIIVTGRTENDDRLVFVIPMIRTRRWPLALVESADLKVSDYTAAVVDPASVGTINSDRTFRRRLRRTLPFLFRMQKVRGDGPDPFGVLSSSQRTFMGYHAHEVHLHAPFESWRSKAFTPSFARFLAKKRKGLQRHGTAMLRELTDRESIGNAFRLLRSFREQRWAKDLLRQKDYFDFYVDVATSGAKCGLARTYVFSCGEKAVGVLFGLNHRGRFLFLVMGFDFESFRNSSLGLLMLESAIEDAIAKGDTVFDFTIGDEAYKAEFGTAAIPMYAYWLGAPPIPSVAKFAFNCLVKLRSLKSQKAAALKNA